MRIIRGKKAMVTGAASGIGRAIALELAKEGADLFLVDIQAGTLATVAQEARTLGVNVMTAVCDLTDPSQISGAVEQLRNTWKGLNILVNNAGTTYYGQTHQMSGEQWNRIMAVNLMAPIQLVHELLPMLLAADEAHILNVCSIFGLVTWRKTTAYQTSKFGLVGFSAALRAEYCNEDFGVTALCPGFVRSSLLDDCETDKADRTVKVPAWICASPEQTAAKAVRAIQKNKGLVLVTPTAHFYWRLMRLSPSLVDWLTREGWRRRGKTAASAPAETNGSEPALPPRVAKQIHGPLPR
ncbi:MAG: SDR family oxidoreductase [Xanthobacteraceae bacterium]